MRDPWDASGPCPYCGDVVDIVIPDDAVDYAVAHPGFGWGCHYRCGSCDRLFVFVLTSDLEQSGSLTCEEYDLHMIDGTIRPLVVH